MIFDQYDFDPYEVSDLPRRWRKGINEPLLLLGTRRFRTQRLIVALFWGVVLLFGGSLLAGPTLIRLFSPGQVLLEVNGEPLTLGWERAGTSAFVLGFLLLFPSLGLFALWYAARILRTPAILLWLTEEGIQVRRQKETHLFPWHDFKPAAMTFRLDGTAILPRKGDRPPLQISRVALTDEFFQLSEQHISGNTDLVRYHQYKEQRHTTNTRSHRRRRRQSSMLYVLKPLTIALGLLLFGAIPFLFIVIVHLRDDGTLLFRFFEYGAVAMVSVFTLAALWQIGQMASVEYSGSRPARLWQVLGFRQNVVLLGYGVLFFWVYRYLPGWSVPADAFFGKLYFFFALIPLFFVCLGLINVLVENIRPYLYPVLALREFGPQGIAGQWAQTLSPQEYLLEGEPDVFLHQVGGLFRIKPVFAYYDRRLNPDGLQDEAAEYFLQSEEWLAYVTACAKIAQAVIIVPATSESLLMEMTMLREQELLAKTFVLMPPEKRGSTHIQQQWEAIRISLTAKGFHLPAYEQGGLVYLPHADYSERKGWRLHRSMQNLFFIPRLRRWQLSQQSIYDQLRL